MNIWNAEIRLISIPSNDRSIRVSCQQVSRRLQTNYTKYLKQTSFKPCTQQLSRISVYQRFRKRRISSRFCPFRNWRRSRDFCRTKRAALLCQDEAWCRELGPLSFSLLESAKNKRKKIKTSSYFFRRRRFILGNAPNSQNMITAVVSRKQMRAQICSWKRQRNNLFICFSG